MINTKLLKKVIRTKGKSVDEVAKSIGIDKSTFYRRLARGGKDFSIGEVDALCAFLEMSKKDKNAIFFDHTVA